ncbi:MAG: hypothetical protein LH660_04400 [Phormidesmis sp. CAN_BIN36]|nr:hypothetical protein [Phormidesmis sp. CAN_BIN36]
MTTLSRLIGNDKVVESDPELRKLHDRISRQEGTIMVISDNAIALPSLQPRAALPIRQGSPVAKQDHRDRALNSTIARSFSSKARCFADTAGVALLTQSHALLRRYRKGRTTRAAIALRLILPS